MAVQVGELFATLKLEKSQFDKAARGGGGLLGGLAKAALGAGVLITGAITGIGIASAKNADDQERVDDRVRRSLGKSGDAFIAWAGKNALALRQTDDHLEDLGAQAFDTFRSMGVSSSKSLTMTQELMKRAADISATTGKSFDEVFGALLKGAGGATRGLKGIGIAIDPLQIKAEALKLGVWDGEGAMTAAAKAAAIYSLELKNSASAAGAAAERGSSFGEMTKQIPVLLDKVMDSLGKVFLPIVNAIMPGIIAAFSGLADWVDANLPAIQATIKTVVDAIGTAFGFITDTIIPAFADAFGFLFSDTAPGFGSAFAPIIDSILPALQEGFRILTEDVIPALAGAFGWIKDNILPPIQAAFQAIAENVLPILAAAFDTIVAVIRDNWPTISSIVGTVAEAVKFGVNVISQVIQAVAPVIRWLAEKIFPILGKAAGIVLGAIDVAFKAIGVIWNGAWDIAKAIAKGIGDAFNALVGVFKFVGDTIAQVFRGAMNFLIGIVNAIIGAVNSIQVHIGRIGLDTPMGFIGVGPFDWNGLQIPRLKYLEAGTPFFGGGLAMLGERGPELAELPAGTRVHSARDTARMLERGATHYHLTVQGDLTAKDEPSVIKTLQRLSAVTVG